MKTLIRAAGCALVFGILAAGSSGAVAPPEWRANDDATGQEYQRDIDASVQPDSSWTAVWLDYRRGYPGLRLRSFDAHDSAGGPSIALTDGLGLFGSDLTPRHVGEPNLAPLGDGRSLLVWSEGRDDLDRIRAAIVGPSGILIGPVTVSHDLHGDTKYQPRVAISGGLALVTWTQGGGAASYVFGQVLDMNLQRVGPDNFRIYDSGQIVHQQLPRVAADTAGWVVAWQDGLSPQRVLLGRVNPSGQTVGAPAPVDSSSDWQQGEPAIAATPGGFLVCWTGWRQVQETQVRLFARTFDRALSPVQPIYQVIPDSATITPRRPEAARLDDASVLLVWSDGGAHETRFHARPFDLATGPTGSFVVVDDPGNPPSGADLVPRNLALRGGGGAPLRLLWTDNRDGWDLDYDLRVDASGRPAQGGPVPVESADGTASQLLPAVGIFPDKTGLVAWEDFRTGGLSFFGVYLDNTGRPHGPSFRISATSTGSLIDPADNLLAMIRNRPTVAVMGDGRAAVAWTLFLPGGGTKVFLQHFDRGGVPLGDNLDLAAIPTDDASQLAPQVAAITDTSYIVVWNDFALDTGGDIFGKIFLSDGAAQSDTIHVVDADYDSPRQHIPQITPVVASSGAGEVVVAWLDQRNGNMDVFAQRLDVSGAKIGSNFQVNAQEGETAIPQSDPSISAAAGRYVVVWDDNPLGTGLIGGKLVVLPSARKRGSAEDQETPFAIQTGVRGFKYPKVAMEPDGQFVVTYWDTSADSVRMMAQRYDNGAVVVGRPYCIAVDKGRTAALPGDVAVTSRLIQYAYADGAAERGWDAVVRRVNWSFDGDLSPVSLAGWFLEERSDALVLHWSVPRDRAGATYHVWREEADGADAGVSPGPAASRLTPDPIGPLAAGGTDYAYRDVAPRAGVGYAYWIEDATGQFAGPWIGRLGPSSALGLAARGNPFHASLDLSWAGPSNGRLLLTIHDASGRRVRKLIDRADPGPARGDATWDGRDDRGRSAPAGVYWARLRAEPGGERTVQILKLP